MKFQTGDILTKVLVSPSELLDRITYNFRWLHASIIVVGPEYTPYAIKESQSHTYVVEVGRYLIPIEGYVLGNWKRDSVAAINILKRGTTTPVDPNAFINLYKNKFRNTPPPSNLSVVVNGIGSFLGFDTSTHQSQMTCGGVVCDYLIEMGLVYPEVNPGTVLPFCFRNLKFGQTCRYTVENLFDKQTDSLKDFLYTPLLHFGQLECVEIHNVHVDAIVGDSASTYTHDDLMFFSGNPRNIAKRQMSLENEKRKK